MPKAKDKTEPGKKVEEVKAAAFYYAVGRRKEASARVRLYVANDGDIKMGDKSLTKGQILVNDRPVENYFPGELWKKMYLEPYRTTNTMSRFVTTVRVEGGGLAGQLGAVIHGISRALDKVEHEKFHPILKKRGFLTRDPRAKQRRKAGFAGKSRKKKQSPKR